ncbi:MAG TPA: ATP:cob(I)alamin adenosyltransferase, partial [Verrucomicrobiae bacterium]|nr:ATP:cob(I)alamin adenosyltransferase [Verrucomicrobiae bacterium]
GFKLVNPGMTTGLETVVKEIESKELTFKGWAIPGTNAASACLDVARTVCRRAERGVCSLHEKNQLQNPEIIIYLNRLSDLLWLLARTEEQPSEPG